MQLPTWGAEFTAVRERAYNNPSHSDISNYIWARSMNFCESCGSPSMNTIASIAADNSPRSYVALCGKCCSQGSRSLDKVNWLEDNLSTGGLLYVTAAIISSPADEVLICQKPNFLWEFPGGKMDEGEDLLGCLEREIKEELAITIEQLRPFLLVDHDYGKVKLRLFSFTAELNGQAEKIQLHDHISYSFKRIEELEEVCFSKADVAVALELAEQRKTFLRC